MTFMPRFFCALLWLGATFSLSADEDPSRHDSHRHQQQDHNEDAEGPHGGTWLEQGDIALELTTFAAGIKPEMRVYAYRHGEPLAPSSVELSVQLTRLGSDSEQLSFSPENDYLHSDKPLLEPHSYRVEVSAQINNQRYQWAFDSFHHRSEISDRLLALANVKTELAQPQTLSLNDSLFGVIAAPNRSVFGINAPYPGLVERVFVDVGSQVKKGQPLLQLYNTETLQSYTVKSPAAGEVTELNANIGDRAEIAVLLQVAELSRVWVELSAFPQSIEKLAVGQSVVVYDLHQHQAVDTSLDYIAPQMTGGHIARARAVIDNADGHWRVGMHVKANIETARREVSLAVRTSAVQTVQGESVVFVKYGNVFEARNVKLGESDGRYIEVLEGLAQGTEYVTENSFLLKAEILKSGASHSH